MDNKEIILEVIFDAIDKINETLPQDHKISKDTEAVLYRKQGGLDSLSLTLLIVALEQHVEQRLNVSVTLIDQLFFTEDTAFRNIKTLQDHIERLIRSKNVENI